MIGISQSELHRTVRNIMLNDYGISKREMEEEMRTIIRDEAERILREKILQENFFTAFVKQAIVKILHEGKVYRRYEYTAIDFDEYLNGIMTKTFTDLLKEQFTLKLTEKNHD